MGAAAAAAAAGSTAPSASSASAAGCLYNRQDEQFSSYALKELWLKYMEATV